MRHPLRDAWDEVTGKMRLAWEKGLSAGKLKELALEQERIRTRLRRKGLGLPR